MPAIGGLVIGCRTEGHRGYYRVRGPRDRRGDHRPRDKRDLRDSVRGRGSPAGGTGYRNCGGSRDFPPARTAWKAGVRGVTALFALSLLIAFSAIPLNARGQTTELVEATFDSIADATVLFVGFAVENGTNFRQFTEVHLGTGTPATFFHAFYRFDLSTVFVGSQIVSANLTLKQVAFQVFGCALGPCDQMNVTAFATAVGWTEETLTFDVWDRDRRDFTGLSGSTEVLSNATTGTFVTWNVTVPVDAWVNGVRANHGFRLGALDPGLARLSSREAVILGDRPALTVRYLRVIPEDPGVHPLAPFIAQLGVPVEIFLFTLGIIAMVLTYFGLFAAHYPERIGGRRPPPLREQLRRFR